MDKHLYNRFDDVDRLTFLSAMEEYAKLYHQEQMTALSTQDVSDEAMNEYRKSTVKTELAEGRNELAVLTLAQSCVEATWQECRSRMTAKLAEKEKMNDMLREKYADQLVEIDELKDKVAELEAQLAEKDKEIMMIRNDLLDALDLKNGKGPTTLSILSNRIAELEAQLKSLREFTGKYALLIDQYNNEQKLKQKGEQK